MLYFRASAYWPDRNRLALRASLDGRSSTRAFFRILVFALSSVHFTAYAWAACWPGLNKLALRASLGGRPFMRHVML